MTDSLDQTKVAWIDATSPNRVPPRECIAAARDALNRAYSQTEAPWSLIAEAVDWQRRALEQMTDPVTKERVLNAADAVPPIGSNAVYAKLEKTS